MSIDGVKMLQSNSNNLQDVPHCYLIHLRGLQDVPHCYLIHLRGQVEVRCVWKLRIINGLGYHSDLLFHDPFYRQNHYERSKLQPLFLSSYHKGEQSPFFVPSIDRSRALTPLF